jgi:hypothetical protein
VGESLTGLCIGLLTLDTIHHTPYTGIVHHTAYIALAPHMICANSANLIPVHINADHNNPRKRAVITKPGRLRHHRSLVAQVPTFRDLSLDCGESISNLWKLVRDVVGVMDACIVKKLIRPIDDTSPISTRSTLPHVKIIVDTTFIPVPKRHNNPNIGTTRVSSAVSVFHAIAYLCSLPCCIHP